ncbi:SAP domain-containing ribonucleoprotein [Fasciola hepatica]|uniref:SAP domain-containing ribonucleoprotein n=1 Tax=Fasciola hepatica TaxID=6192 RepID=A0A4E0RZE2_FASHE|nr:SAP domain-containing ribonucleoprotein [Fasciola hepatica]
MSKSPYTTEELEKLKLSEIKKLCKKEGKPTTGTKLELIARLVESKEESFSILQPGEEAKLLGDVDEEENSFGATDTSALENLTKPMAVSWSETSLNAQSPGVIETPKNDTLDAGLKRPIAMSESPVKEHTEGDAKNDVAVSGPTKITMNEDSTSSESELLTRRANRFGLSRPACGMSLTDDKLAARARRFGLPVAESHSEIAGVRSDTSTLVRFPDEAEKLKRRAERFGEVTSEHMVKMDDAARKAIRLQRFGQSAVSTTGKRDGDTKTRSELEMKVARAEKFGIETDEDKLQKRKARFGLS